MKFVAIGILTLFSFILILYVTLEIPIHLIPVMKNILRNQSQKKPLQNERDTWNLPFIYFNESKNEKDLNKLSKRTKEAKNRIIFEEKFPKGFNEDKKREKNDNGDERYFEDKCVSIFDPSNDVKKFEKKQDFEFLETEEAKSYKTILAYNYAYGKSFGFGFGREPFEAACCKEKRCFVTDRRDKTPVEEFDAIIFHFRNLNTKMLPTKRKKTQRWIFYEREPPPYSSGNPQDYEGVFNWTMTYRRDSDIISGYGEIIKRRDFQTQDFGIFDSYASSLESVMKTKIKLVGWIVSHCNVASRRSQYTKKLQKYIPVDIYGKCGPLKCKGRMSQNCYKKMEKNYKFYLSFENNFCKDYVTEKFFKIMSYNIVPIVLGRGDYASIAPPHSYINVLDFKTPKDLADYLKYLDKNDTAYMEFFEWKKDYVVLNMLSWFYHATSFCSLCYKLHNDKEEKIYYNLTDWFKGQAKCNVGL